LQFGPGIQPAQTIEALIAAGHVHLGAPLAEGQVQPASLDLRLGRRVFRVRASFLPGRDTGIADRIASLALHEIDLTPAPLLENGAV